jgi:hypothetical protein
LERPLTAGARLLVPVPSDPIPSAGPECGGGEEQSPLAVAGHRNQRGRAVGRRRPAAPGAGIWAAARGEKRGFGEAAAALRRREAWVAMEEGMGGRFDWVWEGRGKVRRQACARRPWVGRGQERRTTARTHADAMGDREGRTRILVGGDW